MYCTDAITGETRFELSAANGVREVILEFLNGGETRRVPMRRERSRWIAHLALAPGWVFYRFNLDGRPRWDRQAGSLCAGDGLRYSLAVINRPASTRRN